jgi:hypothetical protein
MGAAVSIVTKYEIHRLLLRWQVVRQDSFPNGLDGVRVRPFTFAERRFWRFSSAVEYAEARKSGRIAFDVITGWQ